jgi:hypothetical protein
VAAARIGELTGLIEQNLVTGYRNAAYQDVQREHAKYIQALQQHPRTLVGKQVPSMTGEGMETLKDAADAREWQGAVADILTKEVESRAGEWIQSAGGFMETVHSSISMFQANPDLIPGTKMFNRELADEFARTMKPYESRINGKLHGYTIPTQPIIDSLRKQFGSVQQQEGATVQKGRPRKESAPQAGIRSKAPTSGEKEDFSTLFGTIGLPHLKI